MSSMILSELQENQRLGRSPSIIKEKREMAARQKEFAEAGSERARAYNKTLGEAFDGYLS